MSPHRTPARRRSLAHRRGLRRRDPAIHRDCARSPRQRPCPGRRRSRVGLVAALAIVLVQGSTHGGNAVAVSGATRERAQDAWQSNAVAQHGEHGSAQPQPLAPTTSATTGLDADPAADLAGRLTRWELTAVESFGGAPGVVTNDGDRLFVAQHGVVHAIEAPPEKPTARSEEPAEDVAPVSSDHLGAPIVLMDTRPGLLVAATSELVTLDVRREIPHVRGRSRLVGVPTALAVGDHEAWLLDGSERVMRYDIGNPSRPKIQTPWRPTSTGVRSERAELRGIEASGRWHYLLVTWHAARSGAHADGAAVAGVVADAGSGASGSAGDRAIRRGSGPPGSDASTQQAPRHELLLVDTADPDSAPVIRDRKVLAELADGAAIVAEDKRVIVMFAHGSADVFARVPGAEPGTEVLEFVGSVPEIRTPGTTMHVALCHGYLWRWDTSGQVGVLAMHDPTQWTWQVGVKGETWQSARGMSAIGPHALLSNDFGLAWRGTEYWSATGPPLLVWKWTGPWITEGGTWWLDSERMLTFRPNGASAVPGPPPIAAPIDAVDDMRTDGERLVIRSAEVLRVLEPRPADGLWRTVAQAALDIVPKRDSILAFQDEVVVIADLKNARVVIVRPAPEIAHATTNTVEGKVIDAARIAGDLLWVHEPNRSTAQWLSPIDLRTGTRVATRSGQFLELGLPHSSRAIQLFPPASWTGSLACVVREHELLVVQHDADAMPVVRSRFEMPGLIQESRCDDHKAWVRWESELDAGLEVVDLSTPDYPGTIASVRVGPVPRIFRPLTVHGGHAWLHDGESIVRFALRRVPTEWAHRLWLPHLGR